MVACSLLCVCSGRVGLLCCIAVSLLCLRVLSRSRVVVALCIVRCCVVVLLCCMLCVVVMCC